MITLSGWADKAELGGAVMAMFGMLVLVFGWKVGDVFEEHYKLPTMLAGGIMLVIGLTVYFVLYIFYPQFCCSVCRKSLKGEKVQLCPKCGAELGGEAIDE